MHSRILGKPIALAVIIGIGLHSAVTFSASAEEPKPSRQAFICEVLDAKPTEITPKFNDYTPDRYHIDKQDLLAGITEEAGRRKLVLRGVLIAGPMPDPLWTSVVAVFLAEGKSVRVNTLVYPHARITYKATKLVPSEQFDQWVAQVQASDLLRAEQPEAASPAKDAIHRDRASLLLMATYDATGHLDRINYGNPDPKDDPNKRTAFEKSLNSILKDSVATYDPFKDEEAEKGNEAKPEDEPENGPETKKDEEKDRSL